MIRSDWLCTKIGEAFTILTTSKTQCTKWKTQNKYQLNILDWENFWWMIQILVHFIVWVCRGDKKWEMGVISGILPEMLRLYNLPARITVDDTEMSGIQIQIIIYQTKVRWTEKFSVACNVDPLFQVLLLVPLFKSLIWPDKFDQDFNNNKKDPS